MDQWQCRTYTYDVKPIFSKAIVNIHRDWRSTFSPTHIPDNHTLSYVDRKFEQITEVTHTTNESKEIYNTYNSFASTTIDTNYVIKSYNGESNAGDNWNNKALSSSEIIMICAAVGVTLILATNISICAYWRLKTRSNDQQMTTVMLSNLDISSDENTNVHYHEIADIPIEFNTGPSPVETNMNRTHLQSYTLSPIEHVDNMTVTQKTESDNATNLPMGHLFQFVTGMNNEASSPRTDARAIEAGKPISFLALAEINMSDEVDGSSDVERDISRERNPEEVEPGHYENLDRTLREHGSQYSHLA